MKMSNDFELVNIGDDHMAVPVGDRADSVKGVVVLNEAAAYLLENMKDSVSVDDLVSLLVKEYDVDREKARTDIIGMLSELQSIGLVCE